MEKNYFDDLKHFIRVEISQSEARLERRLEKRLESRLGARMDAGFESLRQEMRDGFDGVVEAINVVNRIHDEDQKLTEQRLHRLEKRYT